MRKLREEAIQLFDSGDSRSFEEVYAGADNLFEGCDDLIDPKMRKLFEATYQDCKPKKQLREMAAGSRWMQDKYSSDKIARRQDKKGALSNIKAILKIDCYGEEEALKSDFKEFIRDGQGSELKNFTRYLADNYANNKIGIKKLSKDALDSLENYVGFYFFDTGIPGKNDKPLQESGPAGGYNFSGDEGAPSGDGVCDGHNKAGMSGSDPCVTQSGQDYNSNSKFFESIYKNSLKETMSKEELDAICAEGRAMKAKGDANYMTLGGKVGPIYDDIEMDCQEYLYKGLRSKRKIIDNLINDYPDADVDEIRLIVEDAFDKGL